MFPAMVLFIVYIPAEIKEQTDNPESGVRLYTPCTVLQQPPLSLIQKGNRSLNPFFD